MNKTSINLRRACPSYRLIVKSKDIDTKKLDPLQSERTRSQPRRELSQGSLEMSEYEKMKTFVANSTFAFQRKNKLNLPKSQVEVRAF